MPLYSKEGKSETLSIQHMARYCIGLWNMPAVLLEEGFLAGLLGSS